METKKTIRLSVGSDQKYKFKKLYFERIILKWIDRNNVVTISYDICFREDQSLKHFYCITQLSEEYSLRQKKNPTKKSDGDKL